MSVIGIENELAFDDNCGKFCDFYKVERTLSSKRYFVVYKALNTIDEKYYTIKRIAIKDINVIAYALNEVETLRSLQSSYVVHYYCHWCEFESLLYIKLEYYPCTMAEVIELKALKFERAPDDPMCLLDYYISCRIFSELMAGIDYIHHANIIHRDIRPENVLVSTTDQEHFLKITNFGKAVSNGVNIGENITIIDKYIAPEVLKGRQYDNRVDIYSAGIIAETDLFNTDISEMRISLTDPDINEDKLTILNDTLISMQTSPDWQQRPCSSQILNLINMFAIKREDLIGDNVLEFILHNLDFFKDNILFRLIENEFSY